MLRRKASDGKAVCFSVSILSEALEHLRTAVYSMKNPPENLSKTFHEQSKSHSINYFLQDDPFQTNLIGERGEDDSNRRREMYLPDKYCSFQLRRLKLHDPLEVKCSSVFLCSAAMFHFSSCSTRVSPNFYCCCAAVVSSLGCCKPSLSKYCVKSSCKKSWHLVAHRNSGESSRSQKKTGPAVAPFPFYLKDRMMGRSL